MTETPDTSRPRLWFRVGIVLLVINAPFGYGGIAACGALALATKKPYWALIGGGIYGISWLMLGLGLLLAGKEGIKYVKGFRGRRIRRREAGKDEATGEMDGPESPTRH